MLKSEQNSLTSLFVELETSMTKVKQFDYQSQIKLCEVVAGKLINLTTTLKAAISVYSTNPINLESSCNSQQICEVSAPWISDKVSRQNSQQLCEVSTPQISEKVYESQTYKSRNISKCTPTPTKISQRKKDGKISKFENQSKTYKDAKIQAYTDDPTNGRLFNENFKLYKRQSYQHKDYLISKWGDFNVETQGKTWRTVSTSTKESNPPFINKKIAIRGNILTEQFRIELKNRYDVLKDYEV